MKKENGYVVESREIEFGRMVRYVIKKWRVILLLAVLCAGVAGVVRYQRDYQAHRAAYEAALNVSEENEVTLDELMEQMNQDQIAGVRRALYYQKRATETAEYLDHSILLHADPYAKDVNYIYYTPSGDNPKDTSVAIQQYIFDEKFFSRLIDILAWDTQTQHMWELFDYEYEDGLIKITVAADTAEKSKLLADATMQLIEEEYGDSVEQGYAVADKVVDYSLVTRYNEIYQYYSSSAESYGNYVYHFNEVQTKALDMLLNGDVVDEAEEKAEPVLEATYLNKKMVLAGGFAGIILAVVFIAVYYTFSANVHGIDEIKYLFELQTIGYVNGTEIEKKKWFSFVDRWIDHIGYRKGKYLNYGQQKKMIVSNIFLKCEEKQINKLYVSGSEIEKIPNLFLQELKEEVAEKGIDLQIGSSILIDADALEAAAKCKNMVFIEVDEGSKCTDIANELNLCLQHQINNLGLILVQL